MTDDATTGADWGAASCLALVAALKRKEPHLLDSAGLAQPWRQLADLANTRSARKAELGPVEFAQGITMELCETFDIAGPAWIVERFRLAERLVDGRSTEYLMSEAALAGSRLQSAASRQGTGDDTPTADRPTPLFRRVSDVQEREIEWLWGGRIPWAMPVLLAGDGGVGKSTVAQSIGARLTRGQAMPAGTLDRPRGVLILTTEEDTAAVIRPRMRLMGADLNRVHDLDPDAIQPLKLPSGGELIDGLCAAEDIGLIMVDTGPSFLDEGLSGWRDEGIRAFFAPLRRSFKMKGCALGR